MRNGRAGRGAWLRRWLEGLRGGGARTAEPSPVPAFSLRQISARNPGLAAHFTWSTNPMPVAAGALWLHLGCGERVFDGFVNLDFIPHDERVTPWNLLDLWPEALAGIAKGVFSEDTLEHFFRAEQAYILCNVNRALEPGAVARTLMPSLARLVEYRAGYAPRPDEFLHSTFGVETGGDALNIGLRFSGHRWLHDAESLACLAELCGFSPVPTPCAKSTVAMFDGLNLRSETDSLSFATDLRKVRPIARTLLAPRSVRGAREIEEVADRVRLFVATEARPTVEYALPEPADARDIACVNLRSANLSSFDEHSLKSLVVDGANETRPWYFDETLKSRPCMNLLTRSELRLILGETTTFSRLRFSPAAAPGEYFTLGCAEVFALGA